MPPITLPILDIAMCRSTKLLLPAFPMPPPSSEPSMTYTFSNSPNSKNLNIPPISHLSPAMASSSLAPLKLAQPTIIPDRVCYLL